MADEITDASTRKEINLLSQKINILEEQALYHATVIHMLSECLISANILDKRTWLSAIENTRRRIELRLSSVQKSRDREKLTAIVVSLRELSRDGIATKPGFLVIDGDKD